MDHGFWIVSALPAMVFLQIERQAKAEKGNKADEADGFHWDSSRHFAGIDESNFGQSVIKAGEKRRCPP